MSTYQALNELVVERIEGRRLPTYNDMVREARRIWKEQPNVTHFLLGFSWIGGSKASPSFQRQVLDYAGDLNIAVRMFERVSDGREWRCARLGDGQYQVQLGSKDSGSSGPCKTLALAMCLCALRASGVTDEEIQEAL